MSERSTDETPHAIVTGGAGFLGSHLVDDLIEDGFRVTSLDNFGSGRPDNLSHVSGGRFRSLEHDVREPFPDMDMVDHVYHFASRASPADFASHPIEIATTNSRGTENALEFAKRHGARVVFASTSEVYGDPEVNPQPEDYNGNVNPRGKRAPYDESKRFAEALTTAYHRQHGLDIRTVRVFNTYGPRMRPDDGRVIPTFLSQALRGEDLTIYGDGSQTRSFCYVSDLVAGIRTFADASRDQAANQVLNLGHTREITIEELARTILDLVETDSGITYQELPEDDPKMRRPDISKAKRLLGWEPEVGLRVGLDRTIEYFERELPST